MRIDLETPLVCLMELPQIVDSLALDQEVWNHLPAAAHHSVCPQELRKPLLGSCLGLAYEIVEECFHLLSQEYSKPGNWDIARHHHLL